MKRDSFHSCCSCCCCVVDNEDDAAAAAAGEHTVMLNIVRSRRARVVLPEEEGPDRPSKIVVDGDGVVVCSSWTSEGCSKGFFTPVAVSSLSRGIEVSIEVVVAMIFLIHSLLASYAMRKVGPFST